jgi:hypothetical protein
VLQVVSVALGDLPIDRFLHPGYQIHQAVPPLLHQLDREGVLGVDGPHHQYSCLLQLGDGNLFDQIVGEGVIMNNDAKYGK